MATRVSFRPLKLDVNKALCIVKDPDELDTSDALVSRNITHNHEALDKNNEEAAMVKTDKNKKGKEIPTPGVRRIPSYKREYLPLFKFSSTYIRGKGGVGYQNKDFVEYDMDESDEEFLQAYNAGQDRLPVRIFERLMWRLEVACADATETALKAAGASVAERNSSAAAAIDYLTRAQALEHLKSTVGGREVVLLKVYEHWAQKRKKRQKPLLRRLQVPTPAGDNNPFNVFRQRERVHRPQTRRRRDSNRETLKKLRTMKMNIEKALEITKDVVHREKRKREQSTLDVMLQKVKLKKKCTRQNHTSLEAEALQAFTNLRKAWDEEFEAWCQEHQMQNRKARRVAAHKDMSLPELKLENDVQRSTKRRKQDPPVINPVSLLPPSPMPPQEEMLFCERPKLTEIFKEEDAVCGPPPSAWKEASARFGRGGRLVFDRCDALTGEPLGQEDHAHSSSGCLPLCKPRLLKMLAAKERQQQQRELMSRQTPKPPPKQTPAMQAHRHTLNMAGRHSPSFGHGGNGPAYPFAAPPVGMRRGPGRPPKQRHQNRGPVYGGRPAFPIEHLQPVANGLSKQP